MTHYILSNLFGTTGAWVVWSIGFIGLCVLAYFWFIKKK